jgi:hypothetical protein
MIISGIVIGALGLAAENSAAQLSGLILSAIGIAYFFLIIFIQHERLNDRDD